MNFEGLGLGSKNTSGRGFNPVSWLASSARPDSASKKEKVVFWSTEDG